MAIQLAKNYVPLLDEVYKKASVTTILDSDASTARQGNNANEILIPKIDMDGLGDYSRASGYTDGEVSLTWETVRFNYDRGRKFQVDYLDNEETADLAFGKLGSEFMRTKVAPEADAFTFAKIAGKTGISKVAEGATLTTGEELMKALEVALSKMDEDEVPEEGRIMFITPTLYNMVLNLNTSASKELLSKVTIVKVPQARFYTAIDLVDGKGDNKAGGYAKASGAKDINFMIVEKSAIIKYNKHVASDIITPSENQDADAYIQKYRKYGLVDVYANKVAGVYLHHKA